jgi:hypothetical protein
VLWHAVVHSHSPTSPGTGAWNNFSKAAHIHAWLAFDKEIFYAFEVWKLRALVDFSAPMLTKLLRVYVCMCMCMCLCIRERNTHTHTKHTSTRTNYTHAQTNHIHTYIILRTYIHIILCILHYLFQPPLSPDVVVTTCENSKVVNTSAVILVVIK